MRKAYIAAAIALGSSLIFSIPAPVEAQSGYCRVRVWCRTEFQTCYFSILPARGGISNFTMRGGEAEEIGGLRFDDKFCMSTSGPNNPNTCRRISWARSLYKCNN